MILRLLEGRVQQWLRQFPAVAILGPRKVLGKIPTWGLYVCLSVR